MWFQILISPPSAPFTYRSISYRSISYRSIEDEHDNRCELYAVSILYYMTDSVIGLPVKTLTRCTVCTRRQVKLPLGTAGSQECSCGAVSMGTQHTPYGIDIATALQQSENVLNQTVLEVWRHLAILNRTMSILRDLWQKFQAREIYCNLLMDHVFTK